MYKSFKYVCTRSYKLVYNHLYKLSFNPFKSFVIMSGCAPFSHAPLLLNFSVRPCYQFNYLSSKITSVLWFDLILFTIYKTLYFIQILHITNSWAGKIRNPPAGYPPDIRRTSGHPADIQRTSGLPIFRPWLLFTKCYLFHPLFYYKHVIKSYSLIFKVLIALL